MQVAQGESVEAQEQKIYFPEKKVIRPFSVHDKMIPPIHDEDTKDVMDEEQRGAATSKRKVICELPHRTLYVVVGIVMIVVLIVVAVFTTVPFSK